ncbi:two pore domain potassium channel family protein [Erysipelotrichaceae bacterium RD49]|nr:two pore domain potassium channel family protein [Erysipelotrichaceae bacterium RD49]
MKNIDLFAIILRQTKTVHFLVSFIFVFTILSLLIMVVDPNINTVSDAVWLGFMVVTTIGFGDLTVSSLLGKLLTVLLGLYGILAIGFITGVGASWLFEKVKENGTGSVTSMVYQLEHLDELSDEQIQSLSHQVERTATTLSGLKRDKA